jgi:hypothetical protein
MNRFQLEFKDLTLDALRNICRLNNLIPKKTKELTINKLNENNQIIQYDQQNIPFADLCDEALKKLCILNRIPVKRRKDMIDALEKKSREGGDEREIDREDDRSQVQSLRLLTSFSLFLSLSLFSLSLSLSLLSLSSEFHFFSAKVVSYVSS